MKKTLLILNFLFFCNIISFAQDFSDCESKLQNVDKLVNDLYKFYLKEKFDLNFSDNAYLNQDLFDDNEFELKFPKIETLINAIKYITKDDLVKLKCNRILNFNKNYIKLKGIKNTVLSKKYESLLIKKSLEEISALPELDSSISPLLFNRKLLTIALLKNYSIRTKELKIDLDKLSKANQTSSYTKSDYKNLEKSKLYENYTFLLNIIKNIQKDVLLYIPDDLLIN
jgi:hypothetical protein